MLPVSMRRLVQVHEIHIDLVIGDIPVILRHKMAVGLPQNLQTVDPHLAGRKSVAPGNQAAAFLLIIGLPHNCGNLFSGFGGSLVYQRIWQPFRQISRHLPCPGVHRFQHFRSIKGLAADDKPEFVVFHKCLPKKISLWHPQTRKHPVCSDVCKCQREIVNHSLLFQRMYRCALCAIKESIPNW